jgi:hypothetical protein
MQDKELQDLEAEALKELDTPEVEETPNDEMDENIPEDDGEEEEEVGEPEVAEETEVTEGEENPESNSEETPAEPEKEDDSAENELGFKLKKPVKIKSRGMEIDISSEKELVELAHKGFDYFKKTQELAKWRKDIDVIENAGLSIQELQLLADVKNGDKTAMASLVNTYGYDPMDIEPSDSASYKPEPVAPVNYEIESIVENIKSNPEHAEHFQKIATAVPDDFLNEVGSDPVKLMHFDDHIRRGLADKIVPEALKAQALYGGSFMEHYTRLGQKLSQQEPQQPATVVTEQPAPQQKPLSEREKELRRKATPRSNTGGRKVSFKADAESIWDMSDEDFAKLSASDLK